MPEREPSIVIVTGPTASGKSALALAFARQLGGEIVSADSVQVYRDFNIGSAKPSDAELKAVPHHLISALAPSVPFDAGKFCELAGSAIGEILERGRVPIVSGGTGLYLRALLGGLIEVEIDDAADEAIDEKEEQLRAGGAGEAEIVQELTSWLEQLDPERAFEVPRDPQRLRRALQVRLSTGTSIAELQAAHGHRDQRYRALIYCLLPEREKLYRAIDARVEQMLGEGLVGEVQVLREKYASDCRAFGAIGYRQIVDHLDGGCSLADAVEQIKRDTRRFAKRQLTWWRHQPERLGWRRLKRPSLGSDGTADTGGIAQRLGPEIGDFLQRSEDFTAEKVYFSPLEDLNFR